MMVINQTTFKACLILKERARSFQQEGYIVVVYYNTPDTFLAKLRHQTNGNVIVLSGCPKSNKYSQKKNGEFIFKDAPIYQCNVSSI